MNLAEFLSRLFVRSSKPRHVRQASRRRLAILERLEDRSLMAVFVNDDWKIVLPDVGDAGLSPGDTINNGDDLGATFFQMTVADPADAFLSIQQAVQSVSPGGNDTVYIEGGTYLGSVAPDLINPDAVIPTVAPKSITLSPGLVVGATATVTIGGFLSLSSNDALAFDINGDLAGSQYDQFVVNGSPGHTAVGLNGATLSLNGSRPAGGGTAIVLINNTSSDYSTDPDNIFGGLPEDSVLFVNAVPYKITYKYNATAGTPGTVASATNNDVALIDISPPVLPDPGSSQLIPDPVGSGISLAIVGASGNGSVDVKLKGTDVEVTIDAPGGAKVTENYSLSDITGRIIVFGSSGNDDIKIDNKLTTEVWVFAGEGNDKVKAGGGSALLLGGGGDDHLQGGKQRDLLIGGEGKDKLEGSGDDDILIAGTTIYDTDLHVLRDILAAWNGEADYASRIAALSDEGADFFLGESTVHDDNVEDKLKGGSGSDWFFANYILDADDSATKKDKLEDFKAADDERVDIDY